MRRTYIIFITTSAFVSVLAFVENNKEGSEEMNEYRPNTVDDYKVAIDKFHEQSITFETKEQEKRGLRSFLQEVMYNDMFSLESENDLNTLTKKLEKEVKKKEAFDKCWLKIAEEKYNVISN